MVQVLNAIIYGAGIEFWTNIFCPKQFKSQIRRKGIIFGQLYSTPLLSPNPNGT